MQKFLISFALLLAACTPIMALEYGGFPSASTIPDAAKLLIYDSSLPSNDTYWKYRNITITALNAKLAPNYLAPTGDGSGLTALKNRTLFSSYTSVGNTGNEYRKFYEYTIPANTLAVNGDSVVMTVGLKTTGASNLRGTMIFVGAEPFNGLAFTTTIRSLTGTYRLMRTGSTTARLHGGISGIGNSYDNDITGLDFTAGLNFKFYAAGAAETNNEVMGRYCTIDLARP